MAFEDLVINAGGGQVTARAIGNGRPVVLFHSLLADGTSFDPLAQLLAPTHRVIIMNLPGFAGSDYVAGTLEPIAERMAQALAALKLAHKPILLGNGYGGFVALVTAIHRPDSLDRLILADCGAVFTEPGRAAFRGMSAMAKEKGLAAIADVAMRRLFSPAYQEAHPELTAERKARFLAVDPQTFHNACTALATLDLREQARTVRLPTLVMAGELDEATPPPMAEELAGLLPNAQLHILENCAHVPQLQEPGQFLAAIKGFITV